jgi:hypothetical protein
MYGLGRQPGNNEDNFNDHQYLFSQSDHIMSNSALLTPDPDPRFIKFPDSAFNDYANLGGFVDNSAAGTSDIQFLSNTINPAVSGHIQLDGDPHTTNFPSQDIYMNEPSSANYGTLTSHTNDKASNTSQFSLNSHTSVEHASRQSNVYPRNYSGFKTSPLGVQSQELKLSGGLVL